MSSGQPLSGITVLDLGQIYSGGYAGFLLATAGARVIKIEPPTGENLRRRAVVQGAAFPFAMLNSNKRGITLDLKSDRGRELFRKMVRQADVVLENFTPGVMERFGLSDKALREINPRLVYGCASGFGRSGPYRDYPAMDLTVQAIAGIMSTTGYPDRPPVKAGPAVCDFFAGVHLYAGIVSALYGRERTGVGETVEVTMHESVYPSLMSSLGLLFSSADPASAVWRTANRHSGYAESPYNTYPARDGYVAVICVTEGHWIALAKAMERAELVTDPRFESLAARVGHMDEIDEIVSAWSSRFGKDELVALLQDHGIPCAPVKDLDEVVADPNLWARGMLQHVDHPEYGQITAPHSPMRFGAGERAPLSPSPALGQDNTDVYRELLDLSETELADLAAEKVI
jgi:crotonobetainyl-CoA:carnitine CoA-transferase CaiB-like acyl-CoA transferase